MTNKKINLLLGLVLVSAFSLMFLTSESHAKPPAATTDIITLMPEGDYEVGRGFAHFKITETKTDSHLIKIGSCWEEVHLTEDGGIPVSINGGWFQLDLSTISVSGNASFDVCTGNGIRPNSCTTVNYSGTGFTFGERPYTQATKVDTPCVAEGYPGYPSLGSAGRGSADYQPRSFLPVFTVNQ